MATTNANTITRSVNPGSMFESAINVISSACTWNQGDMLYFNTGSNIILPVGSDANGQTFLGIARQAIVAGIEPQPYTTLTSGAQAIVDIGGPLYGVVAKVSLKSGDSFTPGCKVYCGPSDTNAQTVSVTGTYDVGTYQGASITAASSDIGEVYFGHRYPTTVLSF